MTDIFDNFGVEIEPLDTDQFLKVAETLTRCGIKSTKEDPPILWQSCHILHKQGRYAIVHFKELFILDGKGAKTLLDDSDLDRRDLIASNLESWGLVKLKGEVSVPEHNIAIQIIPFKEKSKWQLKSKYSIGKLKINE